MIEENWVWMLGVMGDMKCFDVVIGEIKWEINLVERFVCILFVWGFVVILRMDGEKLICFVGGEESVIVVFDKSDGEMIW